MSEETRPCIRCARVVSAYVAMCPFCDSLLPARERPASSAARPSRAPSASPPPSQPQPRSQPMPPRAPDQPMPARTAPQPPSEGARGHLATPVHAAPAFVHASAAPSSPQIDPPPAGPPPMTAPLYPGIAPSGPALLESRGAAPLSPGLHAALFVMALPALAPGLIVAFLLALLPRRFGGGRFTHGAYAAPLITALLVVGASLQHPILLVIQVSALGSMTYLFLRHSWQQKVADSAALGYSWTVVGLVIAGGALSYVGGFTALTLMEEDAIVTPAELADRGEARTIARVRGVSLDADRVHLDGEHITLSRVYAGRSTTWARVSDTKSRVWVVVPDAKWTPPEVMHAEVVLEPSDTSIAVLGLVKALRPGRVPPRILTLRQLGPEQATAARAKLLNERETPFAAFALIPGLLLLAAATWRAVREARE